MTLTSTRKAQIQSVLQNDEIYGFTWIKKKRGGMRKMVEKWKKVGIKFTAVG